jgi:hypothetical protein
MPDTVQSLAYIRVLTHSKRILSIQKNGQADPSSEAKWAVACSAVTFAVTALVVGAHLSAIASTLIVGTKLEGCLVIILTAFWAATVSIVTNASNGLGVSEDASNQVLNGNLYYFSWAGFVTAIILLVNYLRVAFGVDVVGEVRNRAARLTMWAAMLAAALVVVSTTFPAVCDCVYVFIANKLSPFVEWLYTHRSSLYCDFLFTIFSTQMGSSARILNGDCSPNEFFTDGYCKRTKFAVSLGAIGFAMAVLVVGMKIVMSSANFMVEFAVSILLAIMNAFGVAYITSAKGPGSAIGNLYYFSWISFLCAAFLAADCFNQFTGGATASSSTTADSNGTTDDKDIEVETFDEQI